MILPLNSPESNKILIETLQKDEIAVYPCDTIYGLIGKIGPSEAKIRDIKGREDDKPFIILSTLELVDFISRTKIPGNIKSLWPGPLTLILESRIGGTVGVRVPDDKRILSLISELGSPIYSTSVNISGSRPLNLIEDIKAQFVDKVPLIIDGGDIVNALPSTILDITAKPHKILRSGALTVPDDYLS